MAAVFSGDGLVVWAVELEVLPVPQDALGKERVHPQAPWWYSAGMIHVFGAFVEVLPVP